jgi:transcriptional regulator with XRE-family HTH domain
MLPKYSSEPFPTSAMLALRAKRGNAAGDVSRKDFYAEMAREGICAETSASAYFKGQRPPSEQVMRGVAKLLELDPSYFLEYRQWVIASLGRNRDLVDSIYELLIEVADLRGVRLQNGSDDAEQDQS